MREVLYYSQFFVESNSISRFNKFEMIFFWQNTLFVKPKIVDFVQRSIFKVSHLFEILVHLPVDINAQPNKTNNT